MAQPEACLIVSGVPAAQARPSYVRQLESKIGEEVQVKDWLLYPLS